MATDIDKENQVPTTSLEKVRQRVHSLQLRQAQERAKDAPSPCPTKRFNDNVTPLKNRVPLGEKSLNVIQTPTSAIKPKPTKTALQIALEAWQAGQNSIDKTLKTLIAQVNGESRESIDTWTQFLESARRAQGDPEGLLPLYEAVTTAFSSEKYGKKPQYISIWLAYAEIQEFTGSEDDARLTFKCMRSRRIGTDSPLFYTAWAEFESRCGNQDKARQIRDVAKHRNLALGNGNEIVAPAPTPTKHQFEESETAQISFRTKVATPKTSGSLSTIASTPTGTITNTENTIKINPKELVIPPFRGGKKTAAKPPTPTPKQTPKTMTFTASAERQASEAAGKEAKPMDDDTGVVVFKKTAAKPATDKAVINNSGNNAGGDDTGIISFKKGPALRPLGLGKKLGGPARRVKAAEIKESPTPAMNTLDAPKPPKLSEIGIMTPVGEESSEQLTDKTVPKNSTPSSNCSNTKGTEWLRRSNTTPRALNANAQTPTQIVSPKSREEVADTSSSSSSDQDRKTKAPASKTSSPKKRQRVEAMEVDETADIVLKKSSSSSKIAIGATKSEEATVCMKQQPPQQTQRAVAFAAAASPALATKNESVVVVEGVQYITLSLIGKGGSCKVFKAMAPNRKIVALKRVKLAGCDASTVEGFVNEMELLKRLRGREYIIQLIGAEVDQEKQVLHMVMELGEIDLARLLQRQNGKAGFNEHFTRLYWQQMLEAVHTIHEERIVHSDLKPANFLIVEGMLKLIDFGIAKAIQNDTTNIVRESQVGTVNYMSPESFDPPSEDGYKLARASDIWSLGCILYQIAVGRTPFSHLNMYQKLRAIPDPKYKIDFSAIKDPHLMDTLQRCLERDPSKRITIPELLKHPFLTGEAERKPETPSAGLNVEQVQALLSQLTRAGAQLSDDANAKLSQEIVKQIQSGQNIDIGKFLPQQQKAPKPVQQQQAEVRTQPAPVMAKPETKSAAPVANIPDIEVALQKQKGNLVPLSKSSSAKYMGPKKDSADGLQDVLQRGLESKFSKAILKGDEHNTQWTLEGA